jgi:hypothetical protein
MKSTTQRDARQGISLQKTTDHIERPKQPGFSMTGFPFFVLSPVGTSVFTSDPLSQNF